jgi:uncharacterized protein (DUF885 family)
MERIVDRRSFLGGVSAASLATALPAVARAALPANEDARLRTLLDRFFYDRLAMDPEGATRLGLDTGARAALKSKLSDGSARGVAAELARSKRELAELRAIPAGALSPAAKLDQEIIAYQLERGIAGGARFTYGASLGRYAPYILSQLSGAYRDVPDFLDSQHGVKDAADADAYLARLAAFPTAIDDDTERQRADAGRGVFAPDYLLDTALKQFAAMRDQAPGETVMVASLAAKLKAANLPDARVAQAERIVADRVFPALDRQRALVTELRKRATHDAGCGGCPTARPITAPRPRQPPPRRFRATRSTASGSNRSHRSVAGSMRSSRRKAWRRIASARGWSRSIIVPISSSRTPMPGATRCWRR